jgi:hypothetical protein
MLETIYLTAAIVAISVIFLCIGIIIKGKFPSMHVSGNKEMRKRGIGCVQSQDREAQKTNPHAIPEVEKREEKKANNNLIT